MMSATHFIQGACFGYFDKQFQQCLQCRFCNQCKKASESQEVIQVRKIFKFKNKVINELVRKYSK